MLRGVSGKFWEALKTKGNFCDTMLHGIRENASQLSNYLIVFAGQFLAGAEGIELRHSRYDLGVFMGLGSLLRLSDIFAAAGRNSGWQVTWVGTRLGAANRRLPKVTLTAVSPMVSDDQDTEG
jgi:hypothetical protein